MVQAEQAVAQAGQRATKIEMFFDTTSLMPANNGVRPDLTTAAGKSLFGMILQFFTVVPRLFWATIDGRPILVLYYAQFVAAYAWGASVFGPMIIGDVAAIGPGIDNLAVAESQGRHIVVDRSCGDLYQREWN